MSNENDCLPGRIIMYTYVSGYNILSDDKHVVEQ